MCVFHRLILNSEPKDKKYHRSNNHLSSSFKEQILIPSPHIHNSPPHFLMPFIYDGAYTEEIAINLGFNHPQ